MVFIYLEFDLPEAWKIFLVVVTESSSFVIRLSARIPLPMAPTNRPMKGREDKTPFCRIANKLIEKGSTNK